MHTNVTRPERWVRWRCVVVNTWKLVIVTIQTRQSILHRLPWPAPPTNRCAGRVIRDDNVETCISPRFQYHVRTEFSKWGTHVPCMRCKCSNWKRILEILSNCWERDTSGPTRFREFRKASIKVYGEILFKIIWYVIFQSRKRISRVHSHV